MKRAAEEPLFNPVQKKLKTPIFPFMSLPAELREMVFEHVVGSAEVLILPKYWLDNQRYGLPPRHLSVCHVPTGCSGLKDPKAVELPNTPYGVQSELRRKYRLAAVYPAVCRKCKSPECVPGGGVHCNPLLVSKAWLAEYGKVLYQQTTFVFNSGRTLNAFLDHTRAIDLLEVRDLRIYFGRTFEHLAHRLCYDRTWMDVGAIIDSEDQKAFGERSWYGKINASRLSGLRNLSLVNVVGDMAWGDIARKITDMKWSHGRWSGDVLDPPDPCPWRDPYPRKSFSTFNAFSCLKIRRVTVDVESAWCVPGQPTQDELRKWRLTHADIEEYKKKLLENVTARNEA